MSKKSSAINVIHWFRQDLRLSDNPAFFASCQAGNVLPIYILDDVHSKAKEMGRASRFWLYHSLISLKKSLSGNLLFLQGDPLKIIPMLAKQHGITHVYWNRCYEPWRVSRDRKLEEVLRDEGIGCNHFNGSLLWNPSKVLKEDQTPYKVYTPFYRNGCLSQQNPRQTLGIPSNISYYKEEKIAGEKLDKILPEEDFCKTLEESKPQIGEEKAMKKLRLFLEKKVNFYKEKRNHPSEEFVSGLSPHLHFGEISPNQVWYMSFEVKGSREGIDCFRSELAWREFFYCLLFHFPDLPEKNFKPKFDFYPWNWDRNSDFLEKWKKGMTGYPMVDAGMRELNNTGNMHNRVRMIVASFLVKNLNIHWKLGEEYFWDRLFDADLAQNAGNWQWVAGCGVDAQPFFRVFNVVTQGEKFDKTGGYIKKWCPELS